MATHKRSQEKRLKQLTTKNWVHKERFKEAQALKELVPVSKYSQRTSSIQTKSPYWNKPKNNPSKETRFKQYQRVAKQRLIQFELSFDVFLSFWGIPCFYCGQEMDGLIGLDRVDSKQGYTKNNIVSSCKKCNRLKGDLPSEDYIQHCRKVTNHHLCQINTLGKTHILLNQE